ncbi:hypothetical protein RIR_jg36532.t1 [Rhizophagus irregularis DAOM 181602=DAOM 197198]|nr:hypothetical protein RIR_jg36532.t1 [Rhizophagus irregularis DAOM 181602=DAOM 197198]
MGFSAFKSDNCGEKISNLLIQFNPKKTISERLRIVYWRRNVNNIRNSASRRTKELISTFYVFGHLGPI